MSVSEVAEYNLSVDALDVYHFMVKISVFDAVNALVADSQTVPLSLSLKKGLYTVRVDLNGQIKDTVTALNRDQHFVVTTDRQMASNGAHIIVPPPIYTSALLYDGNED